jgi:lipoprotein-releasing system permease protein
MSYIIVGSLLITLLATLYPALSAARVQPATALRYE